MAFGAITTAAFGQQKNRSSYFETKSKLIDSLQNNSNYDSALQVANFLLEGSSLSENEKFEILLSKQSSFYYLGQYDSLRKGLDQLKGKVDKSNPRYLYALALLDGEEGNYSAAISKLLVAAKTPEDDKTLTTLISIYNSLGYNYKAINELDAAKEFYLKARTLAKKTGDKITLTMVDNNLGSVYRMLNQFDSAIFYYNEASQLVSESGNKYFMAQNLTNLGNLFEQLGDYPQAKNYFEQCLKLSENAGIRYGVLISKLNLGNVHRLIQEFDQSEFFLKQALAMALDMGLKREQAHGLEHLSWLARDRRDFKSAYELLEKQYVLKDSLTNESVKKQANELRGRYEFEKKENEIIILSSQKLYQQLVITSLAIGFLVLFLLAQWWRSNNKLLKKEMEKDLLREKFLKEELENKENELANQAKQLLKVHQKLEDTEQKLSELYKTDVNTEDKLNKLANTLVLNPLKDLINDFDQRITADNEGFFKILLEKYPDLSLSELRLCAYMRLNLSNKELAQVLKKSVRTIETYRTDIRKKMKLSINENLVLHLLTLLPSN
jgi:tetratricopeptide (TPR) repeat protein